MLLNFMIHDSGGGPFSLPCPNCGWSWGQKKGRVDSVASGMSLEGKENVLSCLLPDLGKGK